MLKDDQWDELSAASHASKAVDFLHGLQPQAREGWMPFARQATSRICIVIKLVESGLFVDSEP